MAACPHSPCVFNNTTYATICEWCKKDLPDPNEPENCEQPDKPEPLAVFKETGETSWPRYLGFRLSGKYNGETPAARWLKRLQYDFRHAGISDPSPTHIIMAIDMLAEGKVAVFIDSSYRALCDQSSHSSADLEELELALNNEFPCIQRRDRKS